MNRISIDKCREYLAEDAEHLSDTQIEVLRDALYALGDNVLDNLFNPSNVCHDHE